MERAERQKENARLMKDLLGRASDPTLSDVQRQQHRDAIIALVMQEAELRKEEDARAAEAKDEAMAMRLLSEEQRALQKERYAEEIKRVADEALQRRRALEKATAADVEIARRVQAELDAQDYERAWQMEGDVQFASLLAAHTDNRHHFPTHRALTGVEKAHLDDVHQKHCGCARPPLKHLIFTHVYYCKCGTVHRHGTDCCAINHYHDQRCKCSFFSS